MTDDPIGRLETDESPAIPPAWSEPPERQADANVRQPDVTCLRDEARAQSKTWIVSARGSFSLPLESRRQAASRTVLSIRKSAANATPARTLLPSSTTASTSIMPLRIAGRSRAKAQAFCVGLSSRASLVPCRFDRNADVEAQLRETRPDIVVDASGPFQSYGADPYRLVQASIALGIGYLDFADGSEFVQGIARFDAAARERGIFVRSGVSSLPVLTAAAVRSLAQDMVRVTTIAAGIAPSPHAQLGLNVIRAIASYAGRPVRLIRDGHPATSYGLIEARRYTIGPPGRLPLDPIRFSLVDAPDLAVLPGLWPELRSVKFERSPA